MKAKLGSTLDTADQMIDLYPKLKSLCLSITGNSWDGDDLAQETAAKVLKSYGDKETCVSFSLLTSIARNQWVDTVRKKSKETLQDVNQLEGYDIQSSAIEVTHLIDKLLKNFTLQQTVIFLLKDVFQYTFHEIAERISSTEGAVKASLFRMRTRLKTVRLEEEAGSHSQVPEVLVKGLIEERPADIIRFWVQQEEKAQHHSLGKFQPRKNSTGITRPSQKTPVLAA